MQNERKMCDKIPYDTRCAANGAARAIGKREKRYSMHTYECPMCGKYHLTSTSNKKR